jgi:HK97 family phage prohead protease
MPGLINVDVVRDLAPAAELRAKRDDSDGLGTLSGHFSMFDNWYRVSSMWEGDFLERTAPGFTADTIAADRDGMRVLFNHGFDGQVGDKVLGSITDLREDGQGAYYEVDLFDTSYNRDLYPGLKAGVYGASFRMKVEEDSWVEDPEPSEYNPRSLPERTITRARVMEFGPVTFPANPQATATARSSTDQFYSLLRQRDEGAFEEACRAANIEIPDFAAANRRNTRNGGSGQDGGRDVGAQSQPSEEARARHLHLILEGVITK